MSLGLPVSAIRRWSSRQRPPKSSRDPHLSADTQPVFDAIVQSGLKLFPGALLSVRPMGTRSCRGIRRHRILLAPKHGDAFAGPLAREYNHGDRHP